MPQAILLGRMLLRFGRDAADDGILGQLSAATFAPDGALWVASDELSDGKVALSRLESRSGTVFADHRLFALDAFITLFAEDGKTEADFEGMDCADGYLWFTGSHSTKRGKPKLKPGGNERDKDLERLEAIKTDPNRFLLGRVPLQDGLPRREKDEGHNVLALSAARLADGEGGNVLMAHLRSDRHLGAFLRTLHDERGREVRPLPGKENGFDVEGLAVLGRRLFLGLRGPVLRGWAAVLQIEPAAADTGLLTLAELGGSGHYRKHFLDLDGLGVRDLARDGDDLLILAGPTMAQGGTMRLYRLRDAVTLEHDSLTDASKGRLVPLFDLPHAASGGDQAEGLVRTVWQGYPAVLVVYDQPAPERRPVMGSVFADVFWLHA